ncbi:CopG family transcriptional regulator [Oricola cellulosilytica]|uniref:Antitoxin n=1 Tax=Oricola cellulosilytica TaxID=1429082 RepID=A0A4V2MPM2_9HYPH|nr:CopG family transcriptional regulator [Oricola cellulosilytica]TCD14887.1 antitoxin [Oricola cellulosilytica]
MRTTLDIDDDILETAKKMARTRKVSTGKVISELVKKGLVETAFEDIKWKDGFPLIEGNGLPITVEQVERLLNQEFENYP